MVLSKRKSLAIQFVKYFGAALVGYVVDFGTLILFTEIFHIHYLVAASMGFIFGLIVVYILSNLFVFGESKIKSRSVEFGLFAVIGVIGLVILNILMWLFTDVFSIYYIVSKILATVFVYMWNFFARRSLYHERSH